MLRYTSALALLALLSSVAVAATPPPGSPPANQDQVTVQKGGAPGGNLPPSETTAKQELDGSPRHGEYVDVMLPDSTKIRTWVVYPERPDKAGVVLIVHEIFGLSDWIRGVADALARAGFIAVAPDLVSGLGPNGGGTESVPGRDDVVALVRKLTPEETTRRINAARAYAEHLPAANGRVATLGFCWGGGQSFKYAANDPPPSAAVVYYGVSPDSATLPRIQAPVLGFYGGDDARVTSTVGPADSTLRKLGRSYEPHVLAGAGHGFLRAQDDRDGANLAATRQAWPRTIEFLARQLATKTIQPGKSGKPAPMPTR